MPTGADNVARDNAGFNGLAINGTLAYPTTLTPTLGLPLGLAFGDLTVNQGVELTIAPGTTVLASYGLIVHGALRAIGTPSQPIIFTTVGAAPRPGGWKGIRFEPESDDARNLLEYVSVGYAGQGSAVCNGQQSVSAGIAICEAAPTIRHSTIHHSSRDGLWAANALLSLTQNTFAGNQVGIHVQNSTVTVEDGEIRDNSSFGIRNDSPDRPVVARFNWWGYASGPRHSATNPQGEGNAVSDGVLFGPWLTFSNSREPVTLTLGVPITSTVTAMSVADYQLQVVRGQKLAIEVTPLTGGSQLIVYGRFPDLPLWTVYDARAQLMTGRGTYVLMVSPEFDGTYFVSVDGHELAATGSTYRIVAREVSYYLSDFTPTFAGNTGRVTLNVTGIPFTNTMKIELRRAGQPSVTSQVTPASGSSMWATFDLKGQPTGTYDVVGIWPDGVEEPFPPRSMSWAGSACAWSIGSPVQQ